MEQIKDLTQYEKDVENWENNFHCNECANDKKEDFTYHRTVANGDEYYCNICNTPLLAGHEPREDNY